MFYQKRIESSLNFPKKSRNLHISTKISIFNQIKKTGKTEEENGLLYLLSPGVHYNGHYLKKSIFNFSNFKM